MSVLKEKYPIGKIFRHVASQRRGVVCDHRTAGQRSGNTTYMDDSVRVHWDGALCEWLTKRIADIVLREEV